MTDSKFVKANDSQIHYVEAGKGDPIVFLHGIPTSSYLWRNVIPSLSDKARCVAPDLIGMGKSDKPDIQYNFFDHVNYIENFIDNLGLKNVTLVGHGLGAAIGFDYANRHKKNVKAIAFYEAHVRPVISWEMLSLPVQSLLHCLSQSSEHAYKTIVEENFLIDNLLMSIGKQTLTHEDKECYKEPFLEIKHRKPLWQYIQDFTMIGDRHEKVVAAVTKYSEHLKQAEFPKLMLYTTPGFITTMDTVKWCSDNFSNLQLADLEEEIHLPQESNPYMFGQVVRDWYLNI